MADEETKTPEQPEEEGFWEGAWDTVTDWATGDDDAAPDAAEKAPQQQNATPASEPASAGYTPDNPPPATGEGLTQNQETALGEGLGGKAVLGSVFGQDVPEFAQNGLGYSPGQIDMIGDLSKRYSGIDIQDSLVALAADDTLRDDVMDAMMEDETLRHTIMQSFDGNDGLQAQFEDMVRNDPESLRTMLPALREDPSQFETLVADKARDADTALAANTAATEASAKANEATLGTVFQDLMSGDMNFADILGDTIGGALDGFLGPIIGMFSELQESVSGFVSQNIDMDGPAGDMMRAVGISEDMVQDPNAEPDTAPKPAPGTKPGNEPQDQQPQGQQPDTPAPGLSS